MVLLIQECYKNKGKMSKNIFRILSLIFSCVIACMHSFSSSLAFLGFNLFLYMNTTVSALISHFVQFNIYYFLT